MDFSLVTLLESLGREQPADAAVKLLLAALLGGALGVERQRKGRSAGLRTHILVTLGSALLMIVSGYAVRESQADPTRIAAGIITGIGFLGAGAIFKAGFVKHGLTTAAMVWMAAAVGVATGAGYFIVAVTATAIALAAVTGFENADTRITQRHAFIVRAEFSLEDCDPAKMAQLFREHTGYEAVMHSVRMDREARRMEVVMQVETPHTVDAAQMAQLVREHCSGARHAGVELVSA